MNYLNISIKIKYRIRDIPNYALCDDNNIYNTKTCRKIKQCYKNGMIGYWFGKKFISIKKLKTLLYKEKSINIFKQYGL